MIRQRRGRVAMRPLLACAVLTTVAALLAACGAPFVATEGRTCVVEPGDSVYAIAWRYDLDYRDLARWNHLANYRIEVGQDRKSVV